MEWVDTDWFDFLLISSAFDPVSMGLVMISCSDYHDAQALFDENEIYKKTNDIACFRAIMYAVTSCMIIRGMMMPYT